MTCRGLIFGFVAIAVLTGVAGPGWGQELATSAGDRETRARFFGEFAIVDYDAIPKNAEANELRRLKNQRYDNKNWVLDEPDYETEWIKRHLTLQPPSVFPVDESDVIVTGLVTTGSAHLSNDKTGVYSEYGVRIEHVLKNSSAQEMRPGSIVTVDRDGGAVRYANGQKVAYMLAGKKLPSVGALYVFFLLDGKKNPNFEIVTLYKLTVDSVVPVDAGSFEELKGMGKTDFIKVVQQRLEKP